MNFWWIRCRKKRKIRYRDGYTAVEGSICLQFVAVMVGCQVSLTEYSAEDWAHVHLENGLHCFGMVWMTCLLKVVWNSMQQTWGPFSLFWWVCQRCSAVSLRELDLSAQSCRVLNATRLYWIKVLIHYVRPEHADVCLYFLVAPCLMRRTAGVLCVWGYVICVGGSSLHECIFNIQYEYEYLYIYMLIQTIYCICMYVMILTST